MKEMTMKYYFFYLEIPGHGLRSDGIIETSDVNMKNVFIQIKHNTMETLDHLKIKEDDIIIKQFNRL